MKKGLKAWILIWFLSLTGFASSQNFSCIDGRDEMIIFNTDAPEKRIHIKSNASTCATGFATIQDQRNKTDSYILISPKEPGLNATQSVHHATFENGTSRYIGELPISANKTNEGLFINVFQQGGSIYLEKHKLTPTKVEILPEILELFIQGSACIEDPSNVWQTAFSGDKKCSKTTKASYKNPICVLHSNGKSILSPLSTCEAIQKYR